MPVRSIPGGHALSEHARASLNERLRPVSEIQVAGARFHHFLNSEQPLSSKEIQRLEPLLDYAPVFSNTAKACASLWVVPRLGTISPWSSKATEIIRACGLKNVLRIERGMEYLLKMTGEPSAEVIALLHDRMTQSVLRDARGIEEMFRSLEPAPLEHVHFDENPLEALRASDRLYGLALSDADMEYLIQVYDQLGRGPTDTELMMFAQVNSEHCRHKIFNADWSIDGAAMPNSLFAMIRNTHQSSPDGVLSAYTDNAAVLEGGLRRHLRRDPEERIWQEQEGAYGIVIKVETHNHPTGISPFPGAATGSGGEIRDETACGRGGRPKAGLCGFAVSNLNFEDWSRPWEDVTRPHPSRMATPLEIMIEGPIGAASFNNEFGRPCLSGFFRTLEYEQEKKGCLKKYGYHKPIMLAGGIGSIDEALIHKQAIPEGAPIVVLGGPAMLIGLGGGAASSQHTGAGDEGLDFASVQRSNPEMQRRAQEVIEQCADRGERNPILSIHDVGAGGLSNAIPELVDGSPGGATLELRDIPCAESGMSPREIWCNEAQERYVIALRPDAVEEFAALCQKERSPFAIIGHATKDGQLKLADALLGDDPADIPMSLLFGESSRMSLKVTSVQRSVNETDIEGINVEEALERVLTMPSVASKSFLITIGDRSVGGLTVQDQMVGPWQVPVADAAITAADFNGHLGEAVVVGERTALAVHNPAASARMAVAEALSNLAGVRVRGRMRVCLSANWMAASSDPDSLYELYEAVEAISMQLCPELGMSIPVGKDSLSMRASWEDHEVTAPVSLVISGFAPVDDVRVHVTPELQLDVEESVLLLVALNSHRRLGGSALAQAYGLAGTDVPDINDAQQLIAFFDLMQDLLDESLIHAYHDRSDGGLFACLCECAFASHCSIDFYIPTDDGSEALGHLLNEEIGAVIQVHGEALPSVMSRIERAGLICAGNGKILDSEDSPALRIRKENSQILVERDLETLFRLWGRTSYEIARRRDHDECAHNEYEGTAKILSKPKAQNAGLCWQVNFDLDSSAIASSVNVGTRPEVAILREQGINGHVEMAAAFTRAGFVCRDVHMSELRENPKLLREVSGFAACGGFSYGDVLGAGGGWAKNILYNNPLRDAFAEFFQRQDVFALGVCNGCQMMSQLKEIIPGAGHWPHFVRNLSEQFESRLCQVEVLPSPSIVLQDMEGSVMPIIVAHGEGRVESECNEPLWEQTACLRYVQPSPLDGASFERAGPTDYPANPSGSAGGVTALTNSDGRFTIMMPHPERLFRMAQNHLQANVPPRWGEREDSPWLRLFQNARRWLA